MERNFDKVQSLITNMEKKNAELDDYLSSLPILSRKNMLKEITQDLIKNNKLLQELGISPEKIFRASPGEEPLLIQNVIEDMLSNIKSNPTKKIIYLRQFLKFFPEISDQDKNVILLSLKNEQNLDELYKNMLSLSNIFKWRI